MLTVEVDTGGPGDGDDTTEGNSPIARAINQSLPPESASTTSMPTHEPWINGVRGLAALQVVIFHYITPEAFFIYESAWVEPEHPGPRILKLIPIRLLAQGDAMARLFFVLSGYCMAVSFQRGAEERGSIQHYRRLTSAVFRRGIRLFVPFVAVAVLGHVFWFLGFYAEEPPDMKNFCPGARPWMAPWAHVECTFAYILNVFNIVDLQWTFGLHNSLWSVPLELRGSLAIYTTLLGLANTRPDLRISIVAVLASYNLYYSTKELTGFFAGLLIAETQSYVAAKRGTGQGKPLLSQPLESTFSTLAVTAGLYLLSLPMKLHDDPIETLPPDYDFMRAFYLPHWKSAGDYGWNAYYIGSTLLLAGLLGLPSLRGWLTAEPLQSLGDISYSSSLVHFAVKHICQRRILWIVGHIVGLNELGETSKYGETFFAPVVLVRLIAFVVYFGITLACASVLTIEIERPSKEWAHRIEQWLSVPEQD